MKRRKANATIKDVAREAGVSYSTVSRALNRSPLVNEETRTRVVEVADRLGYSPNTYAQSLVRGRSDMLGFVLPDLRGTLLMEIVEGAEKVIRESGHQALILHSDWDFDTEVAQVNYLKASRVGGAIICPISDVREEQWLRELEAEGFPVVLIDRYLPNVVNSFVATDNVQGGKLAAQHLIAKGHKKLICLSVSEAEETTSTRDRMEGFRAAAKGAGLPRDAIKVVRINLGAEIPKGFPSLSTLLSTTNGKQAIFAVSDVFAMALYQTMMTHGMSLNDVDLVGFDDARLVPFLPMPWASVAQHKADIGRRAVEILFEMVERGAGHIVQENIPPHLIVR